MENGVGRWTKNNFPYWSHFRVVPADDDPLRILIPMKLVQFPQLFFFCRVYETKAIFFSCFLYIWSSDMIAFLIMAVPIYMSTMYWDIFVGQISSSPAEHYAVQEGTWKHNSRNLSMIMFYLANRLWYSWQQMYFR